jgi:UDP:flavonoid glycosyltransferase YjiC (YdhE family)
MRVLFLSMPWQGHVRPLSAVARVLLDRGARVSWLSPTDIWSGARVRAPLGVDALPPIPVTHDLLAGERMTIEELAAQPELHRRLLARHLELELPSEVEHARGVLRSLRPDVVAIDGHVSAGAIAAHLERVPWTQITSSLHLVAPGDLDSKELRVQRSLLPLRSACFARYGMDVDLRAHEVPVSPYLNTVFAHRAFIGDDVQLPSRTHLIGAYRVPEEEVAFPWERLDAHRPIVYLAQGTLLGGASDELPRALIAVARELGVQLVMALPAGADRFIDRDVIVVPYAPQIALLGRTSVFVTHGGSNSVMESLVAGVPMLVVGDRFDLAIQSHFVTKSGAGIALDPRSIGADALRSMLVRLLEPRGAERLRVKAIAASMAACDGAERAADLLLALPRSPGE